MPSIFLDITELTTWSGKLTGVPRVVFELSVRFAQQDRVVFVRWDSVAKAYCMVDFEEILNKFKTEDRIDSSDEISVSDSTYKRLKDVIARHEGLRRAAVSSKRIFLSVANQRPASKRSEVYFEEGDVLFVMSDWHAQYPGFILLLKSLNKRKIKIVTISYDILPLVTPQYSGHTTNSLATYVKEIYPVSKTIFAISRHTKKDVAEWLSHNGLKAPDLKVIRLGDDFNKHNSRKPKYFQDTTPYILCVGTVEARKNHTILYYVYKNAFRRGIGLPRLVVVGRRGWMTENIYQIIKSDPEVKDKFIFIHSASDDELSWLYDNCLYTIYPSFYEGWGLPIAESIAHGKTVVASNTSSMPEIAGNLIDYFDPTSTDECLEAMSKMLNSEYLKKAEKRIAKYTPRSWDQTFDEVNNAIMELR